MLVYIYASQISRESLLQDYFWHSSSAFNEEDAGNTMDLKSHRSNWIEREQEKNWCWQLFGN